MQKIVLGVARTENTEQSYLLTSRWSEYGIIDDLMHSNYNTQFRISIHLRMVPSEFPVS